MATGITEAVIEEIKSRVELSELISSYGVSVKRAGSSLKACCPFHHEKTPSFHINDGKGYYHCFGCGESGDAIKFVSKMDGLTFVEAVNKLAGQCGVKIEQGKEDPAAGRRRRLLALMAELAQFYRRCLLQTKEAQLARDYLKERDLGERVQEDFLIGYAPNGMAPMVKWAEKYKYTLAELEEAGVVKAPQHPHDKGYSRFGGRLMFSIKDKQGRVVAFSGRQLVASRNSGKYVNSPETSIFRKSNILFGFDRAAGNISKSPHREAIICEGQIDTIRLHERGFPVAVASQGTAFTEEHVSLLKKVADQAVLVFDDDAAGRKATVRTARLFLAAEMPVRVVSLPEGDDPDSFLRRHPAEDFQRLLDNAESIMSFQVRAERAAESNPDSIEAMARISKAVLATVASSKSAVVRAGMAAEAAKLLSLPVAALNEELEKIKTEPARKTFAAPEPAPEMEIDDFEDVDCPFEEDLPQVESAAVVIPPPEREFAFCGFLMENEGDETISGMVGEFLPPGVFAHDFTRAFVECWLSLATAQDDPFPGLRDSLGERERGWLDRIFEESASGRSLGSGESAAHNLENFIRDLWIDHLRRRRGDLPACDQSFEAQRFEISYNMRRLKDVKWNSVKAMIRELKKGVQANGHQGSNE
jgi:DNA primase